jgi:hypothetical protein
MIINYTKRKTKLGDLMKNLNLKKDIFNAHSPRSEGNLIFISKFFENKIEFANWKKIVKSTKRIRKS